LKHEYRDFYCRDRPVEAAEVGFIAKFVEANGEAMNRGEVTLAMLGGDAE